MKFTYKRGILYGFIYCLSLCIVSCSSTKKIKYFQDIPDSGRIKMIAAAPYEEPKVRVDDILTVIIQTIDPGATQSINSSNITIGGGVASTSSPVSLPSLPNNQQGVSTGYLVDKNGEINIPVLGKMKVVGFTTSQLVDKITLEADKWYKNPTVNVRFANFKITVAGEVARPGQYIVPNEKVTVMDAIAMAGDLTIYGKRENVLLIRDNVDGTKTPYRFNLKKSDILTSPYYYLRQNDYIYIEPGAAKAASTDASQARYYTLVGSLLSVLIVLFTRK